MSQNNVSDNGSDWCSDTTRRRGRECVFSNLNIYVCGQLVDMSDSATHLGHFIASTDKKSIVKSAKSCFWRSLNFLMSDFGQLSYIVKCKLFNQYCCSFYGPPLWSLKSTIVESMCVDWRKALRSLWRVAPEHIVILLPLYLMKYR